MDREISLERAVAIIEAYGAEPSRWPAEERSRVLARIGSDPVLQRQIERERELDGWLDLLETPDHSRSLHDRVIAIAGKGRGLDAVGALLDWLFPRGLGTPTWVWRTVLAAALPLALGFLGGINSVTTTNSSEWDSWEEEIYLTGIVSVDSAMEPLTTETGRDEETPQ